MTISEAIVAISPFPIPDLQIEKICVDRNLNSAEEYTATIGQSKEFELASADALVYLHDSPDITEQDISLGQLVQIRKEMLARANKIYGKHGDSKLSGRRYGFIGDKFNG